MPFARELEAVGQHLPKKSGGGNSPRFKSRLLNPFTFLLVFALAWAHGAWAGTRNATVIYLATASETTLPLDKAGYSATRDEGGVAGAGDGAYFSSMTKDNKAWFCVHNYTAQKYTLNFKASTRQNPTHIKVEFIKVSNSKFKVDSYTAATGDYVKTFNITQSDNWNKFDNDCRFTTPSLSTGEWIIVLTFLSEDNESNYTVNASRFTMVPSVGPNLTNITCGAELVPSKATIVDAGANKACVNKDNGLLDNFRNGDYAEFAITNEKEQEFSFTYKAASAIGTSGAAENDPALTIIYFNGDTELANSGKIYATNMSGWWNWRETEYTYTTTIPTSVTKVRLVFTGTGTTLNVKDLLITPVLEPSPDATAPVHIYALGRANSTGTDYAVPGTYNDYTSNLETFINNLPANERAIIYLSSGKINNVNIGNRTGTNNKYISIVGEDKATTVFSSVKHRGGNTSDANYVTNDPQTGGEKATQKCAALNVYTQRFYGENFTVKNSSTDGQAEALNTEGDGFVFNNIQAKGYQDTYLSKSGRRGYFTNSKIVGATDFVWGGGTVWFENSEFNCLNGGAYIFAPEDAKGAEIMRKSDYPLFESFDPLYTSFFANNCNITAESGVGNSSYYLGRAYGDRSGAAVMNSTVGAHVKAELWSANGKSNLTYLDYGNTYTNAPNRPSWAKEATAPEYNAYLNPQFLFKNMGTTTFDHEAMLNSAHDPFNFEISTSGDNVTITWDCSNAVGYILYKDGVYDQILTNASFTRAANDHSYYAVKALSPYGVSTQAISLGGGTVFEYEMTATEGTQPECDITAKQNNISLVWYANTVYNGGDAAVVDGKPRYYMKSSSTAFKLTGNFKKDDVITLKVWNKNNTSQTENGFDIVDGSNKIVATKVEGTAVPANETFGTMSFMLNQDCSEININRTSDTNTALYINHIKVNRNRIITVKSPLSKMDVEFCSIELSNLSSIGTYLPKVRGEISGGGIYSGTPVFTVVDEDGNEDETVAKVENNMLVPVSKGTTKLKVTYNTLDYTVIPCYINVNVVGSCIRGLVATKNGTSNTISYTDSEIFTSVTGVFEINGNLACNMFYKGTTLKVTIGNPYPTGDVRFRYHVHEKSPVDENYQENVYNIVIENGGTNITLPIDFKNSFVIYAEHVEGGTIKSETVDGTTSRWIEGGQLVGTKTYEFIYIDDMTYFVGKPNEDIKKFDVTEYGKGAPSEGNHSVRGLKFSYGGLNENWTYTNSGDLAFTGPDGVLTYNGYSMVTAKDPKTETNEHYIHNNSTTVLDGSKERKSTISEGTFSLPVIGDYFRFEPEINGTIIVHVLQPGSTTSTTKKNLANRPLFFLDEAGKSQKLLSYSTTSKINFDEYNEVARYFYDNNLDSQDDDEYRRRMWNRYMIDRGYATLDPALPKIKESWKDDNIYWDEEKTRVKYGDGTVLPTSEGLIKPQEVLVLYSPKVETAEEYPERALPDFIAFRYEPDSKKAQYPDDLIKMINDGQGSSFTRESMKDGTGYMLATAGFIKYAFDVKAGKTYNLFSYASKLGFCGYEFIPKQNVKGFDGLTKFECNQIKASTDNAESSKLITLSDKGDETNGYYDNLKALEDVEIGKQYDVKLEREFTANHWTPIVLPFSVSHTKLEKLFGTGTEVLHFDKITKKYVENTEVNTLHLKKHYYDMIVAGTPVFIRPTFVDENGATITEKSNFMFNNVTIELKDDSKLDCMEVLKTNPSNIKDGEIIIGKEYTSIKGCKFVCSLNALKIPYKGVYVAPSNVEGHGDMDRFYQSKLANQTISLKPLRGWIQTPVILTQKAKMTNYLGDAFDFEDETLGIDFIEINDDISTKTLSNGKIYNINGQMVGSALTDINTLPNGIYIVNGKKFTVNNK